MWQWLLRLDYSAFKAINGLAGKNGFFDWLVRVFVNDHFVPAVLGLMLIVMLLKGRDRTADRANIDGVVKVILTVALANIFVSLIAVFITRNRPFIDHNVTHLLFYTPTDSSFPSNPAAATFAFFAGAWLTDHKFAWWFLPPAILMSFSRIMAGVCYPGDVLAGIALAFIAALVVKYLGFVTRPITNMAYLVESRLRATISERE